MAFLEVHQSLRDHRKIFILATELDMPEAHVAGHCVFLWLWSIDNVEDGTLPGSERMVERAAGWQGEPGAFIAAMIVAGMLDRAEDGSLSIHDWMDYAGRLIEKRHENAQRMRDARAAKAQSTSGKRATHVQRTFTARAGATQQYTTQQHTTEHTENVPTERGVQDAPLADDPSPDSSTPDPVSDPGSNGHKRAWPPREPHETTEGEYVERVMKTAAPADRIPFLVQLAHEKIGVDDSPGGPSYARLGGLAKKWEAALVASWIMQASAAHIKGDPMNYLTAMANKTNRANGNGHVRGQTTSGPNYTKTGEDTAPVGWN